MEQLSGFQRDLIHVINSASGSKGLEIKDILEDYRGETDTSRLYPNLDELVEMGYVNKEEMNGRTNAYSLTEQGKKARRERLDWIENPQSY